LLVAKDIFWSEYEVKKSKFISYLAPYSDFESLLEKLKKEHPKARHFVWAYRYLNEFDQIVENFSDAAEPKGTAGKPTLATLSGKSIINSCLITIRYFGGIKLGTGGLVRAYTTSANQVIQSAKLIEYKKEDVFSYEVEYENFQKFEYLLKKYDIKVLQKDFLDKIFIKIACEKEKKELFEKELFNKL